MTTTVYADATRCRIRTARSAHLAAATCYLIATLAFGHEILLNLSSRLTFASGDGNAILWGLWWARRSLLGLHTNPFSTTWLTYPHEASLVFHPLDLLHGILTIPIQSALPGAAGPIVALNVIVLFCFFFSAFVAYLAIWLLTRHWPSAAIAGFAYSFCSFHFTRPENTVLVAMYWPPLFSMLFLRAVRLGGRIRCLVPGVCFGLCMFQSLYYSLFVGILSLFLSGFALVDRGVTRTTVRRIVAIHVATFAFALPFLTLAALDIQRTEYALIPAEWRVFENERSSMDVAGLIIPGPDQGLWRHYSRAWNAYLERPTATWQLFGQNGEGGHSVYVGVVPFLLLCVALVAGPRRVVVPWTACALLFLGLGMGPNLHVGGRIYADWWLPLPYRLLMLVPLSKMMHIPCYFFVPALFGLWVAAAFGLRSLWSACSSRRGRAALWTAIVAWLLMDYAAHRLPTWPVDTPAVYSSIAADPRPTRVLSLPAPHFMALERFSFLQTIHGKPIARGFLARFSKIVERHDHLIRRAHKKPGALRLLLDHMGPSYIVFHRDLAVTDKDRAVERLLAASPAVKFYEDEGVVAYQWGLSPEGAAPAGRTGN